MFRIAAGLVLAASAVTLAADPAKPNTTGVMGYWKPESVVYDGVEQFPAAGSRAAVTLAVVPFEKELEYRMYFVVDPAKDIGKRLVTAGLTVDPAAKTVELTLKDGQNKGLKCHGIYELADGKLRLCYGPATKPRPTTFAAPAGSGLFCETWAPEVAKK